ncbi:Ger(x)C family spore germination protein [Halobacillus salinarum]|uniref:Ger(X)C family spore germination protein n=1 Tax=Halobacillus salinarum TaxID=2932257 RepID=A0ABY4EMA0_9BACI|nr:Ger(x)C family spore germination protein [Halobacillus salinarum]UOQ45125.1 Ger(x)C family spore germination protein [Halobacillus salinarum]
MMWRKKCQLICMFIACVFLLTGCWNSRELDELAIAVSLGIDKNDDGEYMLSVQVINPSEIATDAPTTRPPVSTYTTTGKTLFEAFRRMTTKSPRQMYLSQLRLLIFGDKIAEEGVMQAMDLLYRDHGFRTSFYVTVAKNASVEDILSIITPYEKIPANKIMNSIDNVEKNWGVSKSVSIDEVIATIRSKGQDPVMSGIVFLGNEDIGTNISNVENVDAPTKLEINGLAVFKGDKLTGWLTEDESLGFNYANGNMNSSIVTHPCEKSSGSLSIEILRSQASKDVKMENGRPVVTMTIETEGNIGDVDCNIDLTNPKTLEKINREVEGEIEKMVKQTIKSTQEKYDSDIFGFGSLINRKEHKYWKSVENNWEEEFKNVEVKVKAKAKIRRSGKINQPLDRKG